jgi:hypothetical protein
MPSAVRSDQKADVAYSEQCYNTGIKTQVRRTFNCKSPAQNALFLKQVATVDFGCNEFGLGLHTEIDKFYQVTVSLLDKYYPNAQ